MYCMNCGSQVPDGSQFCSSCGATMESSELPKPKVNEVKSDLPSLDDIKQKTQEMSDATANGIAPPPVTSSATAAPSPAETNSGDLPSLEEMQQKAKALSQGTPVPTPQPTPVTPSAPTIGSIPQPTGVAGSQPTTAGYSSPAQPTPTPITPQPAQAAPQQAPIGSTPVTQASYPQMAQPAYPPQQPAAAVSNTSMIFLIVGIVCAAVSLFFLPLLLVPAGIVMGAMLMESNRQQGLIIIGVNLAALLVGVLFIG